MGELVYASGRVGLGMSNQARLFEDSYARIW
jgi:hypothetical protein